MKVTIAEANLRFQNIETLKEYRIDDPVEFKDSLTEETLLGIVNGYSMNSFGELCVIVNTFGALGNRERILHPRNSLVNLTKIG